MLPELTLLNLPYDLDGIASVGPQSRARQGPGNAAKGPPAEGGVAAPLSCFLGGPRTWPISGLNSTHSSLLQVKAPQLRGGRRPSKPSILSLAEVRGHQDRDRRDKGPCSTSRSTSELLGAPMAFPGCWQDLGAARAPYWKVLVSLLAVSSSPRVPSTFTPTDSTGPYASEKTLGFYGFMC